jgi:hypothetical protein
MRCYFNLVGAREVIQDRTGIEVSDPEQARSEALHTIREQRQADPVGAQAWSGWNLTVVDGTGRLLFSIALDDPTLLSLAALGWVLPFAGTETLQNLAHVLPNALALAATVI